MFFAFIFSFLALLLNALIFAKEPVETTNDDILIEQFIQSNGYSSPIIFDSDNIKQFWIDKTVLSEPNSIHILLNNQDANLFKSDPFKILLSNVNATQDCKVDIIAETQDMGFTITNCESKKLVSSVFSDSFLKYYIFSAQFHLEDTLDNSFIFHFTSKILSSIYIKKIILSFIPNNGSFFLISPNSLLISKNDTEITGGTISDDTQFKVLGNKSSIVSKYNLCVSDNPFNMSVTIKNIGEEPARISVGYIPYSIDHIKLNKGYFPYKGFNNVFEVSEYNNNSKTIIISPVPENWETGCYVVINPSVDSKHYMDQIICGKVSSIKKRDDKFAEIVLQSPGGNLLKKGSKIRINENGASYIYTNSVILQPGEEKFFSSVIKRDMSAVKFSNDYFLKGYFYVKPVIFSHSIDSSKNNHILITDFSVIF